VGIPTSDADRGILQSVEEAEPQLPRGLKDLLSQLRLRNSLSWIINTDRPPLLRGMVPFNAATIPFALGRASRWLRMNPIPVRTIDFE